MTSYDNVDWLIIVLLCIFNIIVLLNLLIAIISETFSDISVTKINHLYKEKTSQMTYVMDTFYGYFARNELNGDPTEFVLIAKVVAQDLHDEQDVVDQIDDLRSEVVANGKKLSEFM